MSLAPGARLGAYQIVAQIGAGGMGEVYRARDLRLGRDVAIKVLPNEFASDPERLARFSREAQVLASLNHPHIAAIYGLEESDRGNALVLEFVNGLTLGDRIAQGPLAIDEALPIARQIAEALEAAHELGIVHRDLKPANIKLTSDGRVKVLDFGLAKELNRRSTIQNASDSSTMMSPALTGAGVILGTPTYMSPEQARGQAADERADIWAFGCVLYEMLVARPAFEAETISDTIARILEREPHWQALPVATPTRVRNLMRRCLQKDQQQRLHDISEVRTEIEKARPKSRSSPRPVRPPVNIATKPSVQSREHAAVSVLIADLENRTDDSTLRRVLEPVLKLALEGASFISAFDRTGLARHVGVPPPDDLNDRAALELAVRHGLGVVLSGSLERQGAGFRVSVTAIQAVTGAIVTTANSTAGSREHLVNAAMRVANAVRKALGDDVSDSQRFATQTFSAMSLEAVREYAAAAEAMSEGKFDVALQRFSKAVDLDGDFGLAHAGMAIASNNLGKRADAEKFIKEALRHLDGMTERERYRTRAVFYYITADYHACVKEYSELIARNAGDAPARNNVALCLTFVRNLPRAVEEMRKLVSILPHRELYRVNLALYADYSGDFETGESEARAIRELSTFGLLALAFAQLLQGQLPQATETYERMEKLHRQGASYSAAGLGDLALYEGRFSDAARILSHGAEADLAAKDPHGAAHKFAALAYVELLRQQNSAAIAAAENALANSKTVQIRFLAARAFIGVGLSQKALTLADELGSELTVEPRAYAKIIEGASALKDGNARQAIQKLNEASALLDTWIGQFDLGRAYFEAGALPQADSAFDRCISRRGEALALFLDERPTYGYLPTVYYYQGRVREALNTSGFANSYRVYLAIRGTSSDDPLVPEVRQRAGLADLQVDPLRR